MGEGRIVVPLDDCRPSAWGAGFDRGEKRTACAWCLLFIRVCACVDGARL